MQCKDCRKCVRGPVYGSLQCSFTGKMIPQIQLDVERSCSYFEGERPEKNFIMPKEAREGLHQLVTDAKNFASHPHWVKFRFVDVLKIIVYTLLAGVMFGVGLELLGIGFRFFGYQVIP